MVREHLFSFSVGIEKDDDEIEEFLELGSFNMFPAVR